MKTVNIREVSLDEIVDLPVHPVADIFPMLSENSTDRENGKADKQTITLAELADSISENGLQEPIVLFDTPNGKMLLDGRNRRAACVLGKIETVLIEDFIGTEEEAETYVLNLNIDRRDLTPGQRAYAAAKYWEMEAERAKTRQRELSNVETSVQSSLTGPRGQTKEVLGARFRVSNSYVNKAHKELESVLTSRKEAEKLQAQATELERIEKEAAAKMELAKAEGKMEVVKEAAKVVNEAANNKTELRERAAVAAETASTKERKIGRVQRGESMNSVYGEQKTKEESDDPIKQGRSSISSIFSNLNKKIAEQANISGQGEDDYNFIARKFNDAVELFKNGFGIESDVD
jgi:ParB-like chromosome segregation protein Spo0J